MVKSNFKMVKKNKGEDRKDTLQRESENYFARQNIPAVFHMLASADDAQQSEEVYNVNDTFTLPDPRGLEGGACTAALLQALYRDKRSDQLGKISWVGMLRKMRKFLHDDVELTQTPQLSSSRVIDVNQPMHIVPPGCRGNKRAMLVGVNYTGQGKGELKACHNDVHSVKEFLMDAYGFQERDMLLLLDDDDDRHYAPTRDNIMNGFTMLVEKSEPGDIVFVQFSGHGGQVADQDGDEEDNLDEAIIPVDFAEAGHILDDDILREFVQPMSYGVHATVLMDCCHSGSVLDLPYMCGPSEDKMKLDDLGIQREYHSLLDRIEYNDVTLTKLVLDDPNLWIVAKRKADFQTPPKMQDDDESFTSYSDESAYLPDEYNFNMLNRSLRKNYTITEVYIQDDFLDAYTEEEVYRLLDSLGHCEDLTLLSIKDAKPLCFDQLETFIFGSRHIQKLLFENVHFKNTGQDYKAFVDEMVKHPTIKKYNFETCYFANKTERPPYVPKMKGKIKKQVKKAEKKQKVKLNAMNKKKLAHLH